MGVFSEINPNKGCPLLIPLQVRPEESEPVSPGNPEASGDPFFYRAVQAQEIGEPFAGFEGIDDLGTVEIDDVKGSRPSLSHLHDEILEVEIGMVDSHLVQFPHQSARTADEVPFFAQLFLKSRFPPLDKVLNEINGIENFLGNQIPFIERPEDTSLYCSENLHRRQSGFPRHFGNDELSKWASPHEEEVPGQCSKDPSVFIMADYHPFRALSVQGEGNEKAPSLHELSLLPLPEEKGPWIMDSPFHQPIFVKVPDD